MRVAVFLLIVIGLVNICSADVIFTVSTATPTLSANQNVVFNVALSSNVANQLIQGIDLQILAGAADGTSGKFIAGIDSLDPEPWSLDNFGEAFLSFNKISSVPSSFSTGAANSIVSLGTLTLDTTSLAAGTYTVKINDSLVLAPGNIPITSSGNSANFTISAVPEPASVSLLGLACVGALHFGRQKLRRRRHGRMAPAA